MKIFGYKTFCGDGFVDYDEECDSFNIGGASCQGQVSCPPGSVVVGYPVCASNCMIDSSDCGCSFAYSQT